MCIIKYNYFLENSKRLRQLPLLGPPLQAHQGLPLVKAEAEGGAEDEVLVEEGVGDVEGLPQLQLLRS